MDIYVYSWLCQSCKITVDYVKVGVCSDGNLAIYWTCPGCQKPLMVKVPLERIIADIPAPKLVGFTDFDHKIAGMMKIKLE